MNMEDLIKEPDPFAKEVKIARFLDSFKEEFHDELEDLSHDIYFINQRQKLLQLSIIIWLVIGLMQIGMLFVIYSLIK